VIGALSTIAMHEHGAAPVCTRDHIDLSTPQGRAFAEMMLVFADTEMVQDAAVNGVVLRNMVREACAGSRTF
jgi:hypothetical protein